MSKQTENKPLAMLRHHVSGAIERGEKEAIVGVTAARNVAQARYMGQVHLNGPGWLLGGVKTARSVWFDKKEDARAWAEQCAAVNQSPYKSQPPRDLSIEVIIETK